MAIVNRNLSASILPLQTDLHKNDLLNKFPSKELDQVTAVRPRSSITTTTTNYSPRLSTQIYNSRKDTKRYSYAPSSHNSQSEFELTDLLQMKMIQKSHTHKCFNKHWAFCLVTFERGSFKMFKASSEDSLYSVDQENLDKQLGTLCLMHAVARKGVQSRSNNNGLQAKFIWELELANGAKYQFLVNSEQSACKWVDSINYWAARESCPPKTLPQPQSSQTHQSLKRRSVHLLDKLLGRAHLWTPPLPPLNRSQLCIVDQVNTIQCHLATIHDALAKLKTEESDSLLTMGYGHYLIAESDKYQLYLRRLAAVCDNWQPTPREWRYSTDSSQSLELSSTSSRNSWAASRTSIRSP
jgi:hypothetical protein